MARPSNCGDPLKPHQPPFVKTPGAETHRHKDNWECVAREHKGEKERERERESEYTHAIEKTSKYATG